ncbi:MAG: hypothetical protein ACI9D0_001316 [Bacteroidia bacterium]|jgi:hypothetical protein
MGMGKSHLKVYARTEGTQVQLFHEKNVHTFFARIHIGTLLSSCPIWRIALESSTYEESRNWPARHVLANRQTCACTQSCVADT